MLGRLGFLTGVLFDMQHATSCPSCRVQIDEAEEDQMASATPQQPASREPPPDEEEAQAEVPQVSIITCTRLTQAAPAVLLCGLPCGSTLQGPLSNGTGFKSH